MSKVDKLGGDVFDDYNTQRFGAERLFEGGKGDGSWRLISGG
jgi:hypothetical protein